jgi:hypothetical protein
MITEAESIKLVMVYEKNRVGKEPKNVSGTKRLGYDIESGERCIEVKKRSMKGGFVFITDYELQFFQKNSNAFLYLVYEKDGKPKLKVFDRDKVIGNFHDATKRYRVHMTKALKESSKEIDL